MKLIIYIVLSLVTVATLTNCMDVVDVNVPKGEEVLAVEALITDRPGPYFVKLTKTAPYFDQTTNPAVQGASVVISDNTGFEESLVETSPGVYATSQIQGKIGNSYKLRIVAEEEVYEATTEIKRVPTIDSLTFVYEKEDKFDDLEAGYEVKYFGPELAGIGDYFRFKVYRNDTAFNEPSDLVAYSDELVDGKYIGDVQFDGYRFQAGDSVKVETMGVTEEAYQFFLELYIQINNADAGIFANPVANIHSNISNVNKDSKKKPVGLFYGAAISSLKGKITDEKTVIK
jgi:hypothetical protein